MNGAILHDAHGGRHYPSLCRVCIGCELECGELGEVAARATTADGWALASAAWASALLGED
jgi:hypothetical protein